MKKQFKLTGWLLLGMILFVTCKKETPLPTVAFTYTVTGNTVTFISQATNITKYEWNFGDGSYINVFTSPVHSYSDYGKNFNVTLTAIGPGGSVSVTNVVTIPPKTKMQLLTGGSAGSSSSKKWRLSSGAPSLTFSYADAALTSIASYPGGILGSIGMSMAYSDQFVFKADGTETINSLGGGILASLAYCMGNGIAMKTYYQDAGLAYTKTFTPPLAPTAAKFTINDTKNYTITTPLGNVTYANVTTLSFTGSGFLGLKDFTAECIVKKLTDTQMDAVIFFAHPSYGAQPMLAAQMTFEVAP
jgi:PKD repeat protein